MRALLAGLVALEGQGAAPDLRAGRWHADDACSCTRSQSLYWAQLQVSERERTTRETGASNARVDSARRGIRRSPLVTHPPTH